MHERDVVEDGNSIMAQVLSDRVLEEIRIVRADDVCLAHYRGLDNDHVVYVANGRSQQRIKDYDFRGSAKEGDIIVNKFVGEAKKFLQTGVTKHRRKLMKHLRVKAAAHACFR